MTDHFQQIYAAQAAQYEAMVAREDYQGNILKALTSIRPLVGLDVVEFGAGTGRVTRLLAPLARSIRAFDASPQMLEVAVQALQATGLTNWSFQVADHRQVPAEDASADLAVEGWSFGHFVGWNPDTWREEVTKALGEMQRILRPGGAAVLIETLGTGFESPQPPEHLIQLYDLWEREYGFARTWIRTDYQFESVQLAADMTRFFFGNELADRIVREQMTILPECTGIWWKAVT